MELWLWPQWTLFCLWAVSYAIQFYTTAHKGALEFTIAILIAVFIQYCLYAGGFW